MRSYADKNPQCRVCKYRKRFGSGMFVYFDYLAETEKMPAGYLDEEGQWHRAPGPCQEFKPGKKKKYTPEDWGRMMFARCDNGGKGGWDT